MDCAELCSLYNARMIIVTGGAGFIGSNLIALLERSGAENIVVVDRLRNGEKWCNIAKRQIAEFVQPEQFEEFLAAHVNDVDTIFHLGGISSTTQIDADLVVNNNFKLSCMLWDWCALHGVRFVYASSGSTYGDGSEGFVDHQSSEALAKLRPLNVYAWSKNVFDRRTARMVERGEPAPLQWVGLKFFNVYGPNEYHKGNQISVAHTVYNAIAAGKPARLFRTPEGAPPEGPRRDFVWVGNCAAVMKFFWEKPDVSGLFNVGTGEARSFDDLAIATYAAMGVEPRIEYIDMPESIRARYQYFTQADMSKLRTAGYVAPFTSIEEGVKKYVQEFLSKPDPYR